MQNYLQEGFTIEKLTNELMNLNSKFYFALFSNKVIGYLKINFGLSQTNLKTIKHLKLKEFM